MNEQVEGLLAGPNFAQFGTVNQDGSPHIDTVWFSYQDELLVIATTMVTRKAKNITANRVGYVVVTARDNPYEQAQLKVVLDRIEPDDSMSVCDAIAQRYTGKVFPQRNHKHRIAIYLRVISCKYHIARV